MISSVERELLDAGYTRSSSNVDNYTVYTFVDDGLLIGRKLYDSVLERIVPDGGVDAVYDRPLTPEQKLEQVRLSMEGEPDPSHLDDIRHYAGVASAILFAGAVYGSLVYALLEPTRFRSFVSSAREAASTLF